MLSLLAALTLAAQPAPPKLSEDADFQCLAIVAITLATTPKQSAEDLKAVTGLTAVFMYYLGRLDVRYPDLDFTAAFKSLDADPGFASRFAREAERCSNDAERRSKELQDMGRTLQALPPAMPGKVG
jgi:hypothetical protein